MVLIRLLWDWFFCNCSLKLKTLQTSLLTLVGKWVEPSGVRSKVRIVATLPPTLDTLRRGQRLSIEGMEPQMDLRLDDGSLRCPFAKVIWNIKVPLKIKAFLRLVNKWALLT